ncbi:hypothetical protein BN946_scf184747.g29 [Trametes cinnabarina]|uniref:XRRM domain-containing protein n=1 Tax=Pycnoporus cinnabarinus TaxID=5643 RepID=A0A060SSS6_PYCCI|nr:hypothetical protein BN946_scf184747.g29 [Trametes cinnabarina]
MFPFVPRAVAQKARTHQPTSTNHALPSVAATTSAPVRPAETTKRSADDAKGKAKATHAIIPDVDLAALLWLSLSDHSLWENVNLRRAFASADDGWIPISVLHQHSPYLARLNHTPPESTYLKALRAHASDLLEVRVRVSAPPKAAWYGSGPSSSPDELGGYELRRKDWRDALSRARNSTRHEWESRTVYMECIPLAHRLVPGIYHFATYLLGMTTSEQSLTTRIQAVSLPSHHLDRPGDVPKPKGFAFVTFADENDAARLAADWPWLPRHAPSPSHSDSSTHGDGALLAHDASKFGFRVLRKARWDELKEEYLSYRQRLLDQAAAKPSQSTSAQHAPAHRLSASADQRHFSLDGAQHTDAKPRSRGADPSPPGLSAEDGSRNALAQSPFGYASPFPPGCLVYVRNVHPETNKTTLRPLFGTHGFGASAAATSSALDYVDYSKGMNSCHLRLSAPRHAQALVSAFQARAIVQRQGLDDAGTVLPDDSPEEERAKAISTEIVQGTKEELYWSKVPDKVRREAVRKALVQMSSTSDDTTGEAAEDAAEDDGQGSKRKRKRRRKA